MDIQANTNYSTPLTFGFKPRWSILRDPTLLNKTSCNFKPLKWSEGRQVVNSHLASPKKIQFRAEEWQDAGRAEKVWAAKR